MVIFILIFTSLMENSEWRVASGDCLRHYFRCYRCRRHGACYVEVEASCASNEGQASWLGRLHRVVRQQCTGWTYRGEERLRKARVRSHARLAAAWLYAWPRSGSKNQCPVPL